MASEEEIALSLFLWYFSWSTKPATSISPFCCCKRLRILYKSKSISLTLIGYTYSVFNSDFVLHSSVKLSIKRLWWAIGSVQWSHRSALTSARSHTLRWAWPTSGVCTAIVLSSTAYDASDVFQKASVLALHFNIAIFIVLQVLEPSHIIWRAQVLNFWNVIKMWFCIANFGIH